MPVRGTSNQIHQHRAYDKAQETMTDIRRALKMWDVLNQWDTEKKDNRPNKADVTLPSEQGEASIIDPLA